LMILSELVIGYVSCDFEESALHTRHIDRVELTQNDFFNSLLAPLFMLIAVLTAAGVEACVDLVVYLRRGQASLGYIEFHAQLMQEAYENTQVQSLIRPT